jgi:hypothetical protein
MMRWRSALALVAVACALCTASAIPTATAPPVPQPEGGAGPTHKEHEPKEHTPDKGEHSKGEHGKHAKDGHGKHHDKKKKHMKLDGDAKPKKGFFSNLIGKIMGDKEAKKPIVSEPMPQYFGAEDPVVPEEEAFKDVPKALTEAWAAE